jgi:hypothetical protein
VPAKRKSDGEAMKTNPEASSFVNRPTAPLKMRPLPRLIVRVPSDATR